MRLFEERSCAGESTGSILRLPGLKGSGRAFYLLALILACSCQPQNVREEKALRRQLSHEMRHHSYESAIPIARKLLRVAPQDDKLWATLVQAQIGLHDF